MLLFTITACLLLFGVRIINAGGDFSYSRQNEWGGICVNGNTDKQSPIDIQKHNIIETSELRPLQLSGWDVPYDGKFSSTGHNVQFDPVKEGSAITKAYSGTYELQQMHMHWGRWTGEGSEHAIDGYSSELEIHFVHTKRGGLKTHKDYYLVIGVLAEIEYISVCGPWKELSTFGEKKGFRFDSLLPKDRDYYFYYGSLTTPDCTENVMWHVMKSKIRVPQDFLTFLRTKVKDSHGKLLEYNYRNLQYSGNRNVYTPKCTA